MNTTVATYSEHVQSRRSSIETIYSIQGIETDFVRDTSDTEWYSGQEEDVEYEPDTADESENKAPVSENSSGDEIIETKVIEVLVADDGELLMADSEHTVSSSDSELDLHDYWNCAHCGAPNNNPRYRLCEKCFKVRKNFFPPRPKRKHKIKSKSEPESLPRTFSQDSGVESQAQCSQDSQLSQNSQTSQNSQNGGVKRSAESPDIQRKKFKSDLDSLASDFEEDANSDRLSTKSPEVRPLVKMVSDPALTVENVASANRNVSSLNEKDSKMCIACDSEPKSGVFVHGRIAHMCCCYKCAMKVWASTKRCPLCNRKVSNVLKVIM
ncbi:unnamed protein product, partial [Brenthis ino]